MVEEYPDNYPASACEKIDILEEKLAEANKIIEKCLYFPANSGLEEELLDYLTKHKLI